LCYEKPKILKISNSARDGDIGKAKEFYFDDENWTVRYLVADTGGWLNSRRVLISPYAMKPANEAERVLPLDLTKKQIEDSPSLATDHATACLRRTTRFNGPPLSNTRRIVAASEQ
jgi:PRC-barrel domain protein